MSLFDEAILRAIDRALEKVEMSFVARVVEYDKDNLRAKVTPLLKIPSVDGRPEINSPDIDNVRVERMPGIRPIYVKGDRVKCVLSASSIREPIENDRPTNRISRRFSETYCTITGRVHPETDVAPTHYSEDGLIINDDPNYYLTFKSDNVFIKGKTIIDGVSEINGNTRSLVTHAELDSPLQSHVNSLIVELGKIAVAINAIVPGSYTPGFIGLDISSSKTDNIKTGAG